MLGYSKTDLDEMINSVHDAKLFYILKFSAGMKQNFIIKKRVCG